MALSPSDRSIRARCGAHALHSQHDSREVTAPARAGFMRRFEDEVDPDRVLSESERARRAQHAMKAHMARLALKSAQARRKNAGDDA